MILPRFNGHFLHKIALRNIFQGGCSKFYLASVRETAQKNEHPLMLTKASPNISSHLLYPQSHQRLVHQLIGNFAEGHRAVQVPRCSALQLAIEIIQNAVTAERRTGTALKFMISG